MTHSLSIFRGKRVLVTGHTGFKGSWLSLWLAEMGARVTGYSLAPTTPSNYEVSDVRSVLAGETIADVRDGARISAVVKETEPEVIFHLAAQPLVRASYAAPRETFDVNVMGTASVLDAVRGAGRPCVCLVITSDKCYENAEQVWGYRECDPMGGYDPYSASKGAAEILVGSYRRSFFSPAQVARHGVKLATVRAGNVIGGGDWAADRIVVDAMLALCAGKPVAVRNPNAIRPWQHVLEPLSGYLVLAGQMLKSEDAGLASGWNFGPLPGSEVPVRELVERLCKAWGGGTWNDESRADAPHEANILRLSIDKAVSRLGWRPAWDLETTVRHTAAWYRAFGRAGKDTGVMREQCARDIADYQRAAQLETA